MNTASNLVCRTAVSVALLIALPIPMVSAAPSSIEKSEHKLPKGVLPASEYLFNGKLELDPIDSVEFSTWNESVEFVEAPDKVVVRWTKNRYATSWAKWELRESGPDKKLVATGDVNPIKTVGGSRKFEIHPNKILPKFNTGPKAKEYELQVKSWLEGENKLKSTTVAKLVHKTKASGAVGPKDPYTSCSSSPTGHARAVSVTLPFTTVFQATNTAGEGDDELYFHIAHRGPGLASGARHDPGEGNAYRVKQGATHNIFTYHDDDGSWRPTPTMYFGTLKHGETMALSIIARERDFAELKQIKRGVVTAMQGVAAVAGAIGGWGAVVSAAAGTIASINETFVPEVDGHDFIGNLGVVFSNRCGRVTADWFTYETAKVAGEDVASAFIEENQTERKNIRRTALFKEGPGAGAFSPSGWDYGDYVPVGTEDGFFWDLHGTSNSHYLFIVLAQTNLPGLLPPVNVAPQKKTPKKRGG